MKKVIIAMLIVLMVPACIFAGRGLLDFTIGATAETTYKVEDVQKAISGEEEFKFSMENVGFGAETELKLAFLALNGKAVFAPAQKTVSGVVSGNLALDILFIRIKAGLGYEYSYDFESKEMKYGNGAGCVSSFDEFKKAQFDACLGVDFLLGDLTIGAHASLPTSVSIEQNNWSELVSSIQDNWQYAKLGVSVGYSLL
ncbi:MAG: hypothetical protein IJ863_07445 [Spirochaetales bacterium]|nr:hypothetical protein [Spirochaetales bacterium]